MGSSQKALPAGDEPESLFSIDHCSICWTRVYCHDGLSTSKSRCLRLELAILHRYPSSGPIPLKQMRMHVHAVMPHMLPGHARCRQAQPRSAPVLSFYLTASILHGHF